MTKWLRPVRPLAPLAPLALAALALAACAAPWQSRLDAGEVGVLIDYAAGSVDGRPHITPLNPGQVVTLNTLTQVLVEYPAAQQNLVMVQRKQQGQTPASDDSVACPDANGVTLQVDLSVQWRVDPKRVGELYLLYPRVTLRSDGADDIEDKVVRRIARSKVADACAYFTYDQLREGLGRGKFSSQVEESIKKGMDETFLIVDNVNVGEIHPTPALAKAAEDRAAAQQAAQTAQFLKQKAENEVAAQITQAEGNARVKRINSEAEAKQIEVIQRQLSVSEAYIRYVETQKWDGKLPEVVAGDGASVPILRQSSGAK